MTCSEVLSSNLVASLVGGFFTALAVVITIRNESSKTRNADRNEINAICEAIQTEIASLLMHYKEVSERVQNLKENQPYEFSYRIDQDYFSVFNSNTSALGKLPSTVRVDIVTAYIKMKSLIDTFKENNHILESYEGYVLENTRIAILNSHNADLTRHFKHVIESYQIRLIEMATGLKNLDSQTTQAANQALNSLRDYLKMS